MEHLKQIHDAIVGSCQTVGSIAIMSHVNPDGDGFSVSLALQCYLRAKGFSAHIVIDDWDIIQFGNLIYGDIDQWHTPLTGNEDGSYGSKFVLIHPDLQYDLVIVLDCNSMERLGKRDELVVKAKKTILLDHHILEHQPIPCDFCYIRTNHVSVGVIFFLAFRKEIEELEPKIRKYIADCIYSSILNDTNNFTNANVDTECFEVSACLTKWGITPKLLYQNMFQNHSPAEINFIGETLFRSQTYFEGRIFVMYSTLEMLKKYGLGKEALSNMTRWAQGIQSVDVVIYLREQGEGSYRVSLRSPIIDVNRIASIYGGGGHKSASGCTILGSYQLVLEDLLGRIKESLNTLDQGT